MSRPLTHWWHCKSTALRRKVTSACSTVSLTLAVAPQTLILAFTAKPNGPKERRYDYVIEHFGAGGDRYLGGENLLELLAFEVFKSNSATLLAKGIQFERHPERDNFPGSEQLLSHSQEARVNTKTLCEKTAALSGKSGTDVNCRPVCWR